MKDKLYYERQTDESEFLEWYQKQDLPHYEKPSVTIDNVIFAFDKSDECLKMLLIKRAANPYKNRYALPGGFINPNEDAKEAAKRETFEETTVNIQNENQMWQIGTFSTPYRDPRGWTITIAHTTFLYPFVSPQANDDAASCEWVTVMPVASSSDRLYFMTESSQRIDLETDFAFDHSEIIKTTFERIRSSLSFNADIAQVLGPTFTSNQLRNLFYYFDCKFNEKYNTSNIVTTYVKRLKIFEKVGQMTVNEQSAGRPKALFSFVQNEK